MGKNTVKCHYTHCKHEDINIPKEEAVKDGGNYYHADCLEERMTLREIENFYIQNFEEDPVMSLLRKTINRIVFDQGMDPKYVLFSLGYAKKNNIPLRHPAGIYYIVNDHEIINEWKRITAQQAIAGFKFEATTELQPVAGYGAQMARGFRKAVVG